MMRWRETKNGNLRGQVGHYRMFISQIKVNNQTLYSAVVRKDKQVIGESIGKFATTTHAKLWCKITISSDSISPYPPLFW